MTSLKLGDGELDNMQRRNVDLMEFPREMLYETYAELNSILEKVDDSAIISGKANLGPFRCFRLVEGSLDPNVDKEQEIRAPIVPLRSPPTSPPIQLAPPRKDEKWARVFPKPLYSPKLTIVMSIMIF